MLCRATDEVEGRETMQEFLRGSLTAEPGTGPGSAGT